MKKTLGLLSILLSSPLIAQDDILSAEEAFPMVYTLSPSGGISIYFQIEDGYKLYSNRFEVDSNAKVTYISPGKIENDEFQGNVEVIEDRAVVQVDTKSVTGHSFTLYYQGCKSNQFCYPIQAKEIRF